MSAVGAHGMRPPLIEAVRRLAYNRFAPVRAAQKPFQEWVHFCIHGPHFDLIVNYSLVDEGRAPKRRRILLVRYGARWEGSLKEAPELTDPSAGSMGGQFGWEFESDRVTLSQRGIELGITCPELGFQARLTLDPRALPSVTHNSRHGGPNPIHWLVVPHLRATGVMQLRGNTQRIDDAPAYHDHNWGPFQWGEDFAWEWLYFVPWDSRDDLAAIAVRLSDRLHGRTYSQGLLLWEGTRLKKMFRADQVRFERTGTLRIDGDVTTVPGVASMLRPGRATGIPSEFRAVAASGGDRVELLFKPGGAAKIVVPDTRGDGLTVIHEANGSSTLEGEIDGRPFCSEGAGILERLAA